VPITRRQLLLGGASALVLAACSGDDDGGDAAPGSSSTAPSSPTTRPAATPLTADPFGLGVASGDPDETGVVLWTRLLGADGDHDVVWEVLHVGPGPSGPAEERGDERERRVAATGVVTATAATGHAVHAVVDGLDADSWYEYRFLTGTFTSPRGRTRTTPRGEDGDRLRFAFGSCQDWQRGFYSAHEHLAAEAVDVVVFLGDYIYEGGPTGAEGAPRRVDAAEVITLEDYRGRYALYRSDPNLQAAHAAAPWFVVWDDHEVDNNYAGMIPEPGAPDVDFAARRAAAYRAWWEHMPTRLPAPDGPDLPIHRALRWGGLATVLGLDGRQHRDEQPCDRGGGDLGAGCEERDDPARSMLGAEQEAWLAEELSSSTAAWNVIANQTIFSPAGIPVGPTEVFNRDQWDGYPAARDRALDAMAAARGDVVIVTGDIHASAVADVRRGDEVVAVELVGPAISSSFPAQYADLFEAAADAAGAAMVDARHNGYVVCEVAGDEMTAAYRYVDTVQEPTSAIRTASTWRIAAGRVGVEPLA